MSRKKPKTLTLADSLCNDCQYRFTQIYIPTRPEEFGNTLLEELDGKTDKIGLNICLLADVEVGSDIVVECSHHVKLSAGKKISIFKHLKD